jgi:hypothetical protein
MATITRSELLKGNVAAINDGLTHSGPTEGIGYATGAGGAVTQASTITTAVTLNKVCGTITTVSSTLATGVDATFTLTNSTIAATDVVVASVKSYGGTADGIPVVAVTATAAGSCKINIRNTGATTLDAVILINFAVIKGVAA